MDYRLDLVVLSEHDQTCRFGMTLHNLGEQDLINWSLTFAFTRFITPGSMTHGEHHQVGSFCQLKPDTLVLAANHHYYCEFSVGSFPFRYHTDGILDAFVESEQQGQKVRVPVALTPLVLNSPHTERSFVPSVIANELALLPHPNQLQRDNGHFVVKRTLGVACHSELATSATQWLIDEFARIHQMKLSNSRNGLLIMKSNPTLDEGEYSLKVTLEGIKVEAGSRSGFTHACATLLQLAQLTPQGTSDQVQFPCVTVRDAPRFRYRGMMLDCSRHFHSVATVKRLINQLAHYKFNTFHWHLSDDEGWRIEINAYPELTEKGAWRGLDEVCEPQYSHLLHRYGGFYTQAQVRDVIEYAHQRGITVIPEIDIPGHCRAAVKSLPDLLVEKEDTTEYRSIQNYRDNLLNPGLAGTYQFLDRVLEEIAELFPAPFVHIGADEVPHGAWTGSPSCQALMEQEGYCDSKELQGHLLRYAEKKLRSLGKRMLGWEEAQHGDKVSKDTVIYSWLSEEAALNCARNGFDVVLQPGQSTYLDMAQDFAPEEPGVDWANALPLERAYRYEPMSEIPNDDPLRKRIWGIQTALWCEIINHPARVDYMIFPRLTAMAEAGWTQNSRRDWLDYLGRLKGHLVMLDKQAITYRNPWK
ncbi:beta-N-acetylhexosaminidase [Vibrio sp. SM6]|uniref:beta-N-acetylhexosaminidase n=1 Tax=Vibrio agarilyticus TaxID=2726741 RepID=A0A7X8TQ14_9VIBR|nr:family 20 glycosylhydrolase [Vibrio agarilyticus]NLS12753.1 beta-N-acetylhexosaminidase [Vibrio agarilyticus]